MQVITENMSLNVIFIKGTKSIEKISKDWDDLYSRADKTSPVYSRIWVQAFLFGKENEGTPTLITIWDNSKLVALFPFTIRNYWGIKVAIGSLPKELCRTGILLDPEYKQAINLISEACINEKDIRVFYNLGVNLRNFYQNL